MSVLTPEQFADTILGDGVRDALIQAAKENSPEHLTAEHAREVQAKLVRTVEAGNHTTLINARLGKMKTSQATREYLGKAGKPCSLQAVNDRVKKHNLLRLKNKAGRNAFPVFQFANGGVHPNIRRLLHILLGSGMTEWGVAFWLTEPLDVIDGRRAIDVLEQNETFALVLQRATMDAADRKAAQ